MRLRTPLAILCLLVMVDCVAIERRPSAPNMSTAQAATADTLALDRQVLVMLHAPALHFRPDASYAGSYQTAPGREARRRIARRLAREHGLHLLDDWPMPALGVDCFVMQLPADASLPADTSRTRLLQELTADPRVAWAQAMHRFQLLGAGDPLYPVQPAARRWRLAELHALAKGRGVVVATMDTGVQTGHPDLRGQVVRTRNFVDDAPPPAEAHGTEVAGIIAARADNGIGVAGIAPQARLLALRACWQRPDGAAACSSFTLAKAMQFALQADVQVLNLSLTGPHDALLARLLDAALARGITIVGAVDARSEDGGFPASHAGVLAVTGDPAESGIAGALLAPGQDIPTTTSGGGWRFVAGPSFAAAQVAGLAALLHELSPRLRPARLRAALAPKTALGLPARRPMSIDACAAVVRVSERCACDCAAARTASSMPRR